MGYIGDKPMYVNNVNYKRTGLATIHMQLICVNQYKQHAEQRMQAMDKLPKAARAAVHEYGQLGAAIRGGPRAADKVKAVKRAYAKKLERTSTYLD